MDKREILSCVVWLALSVFVFISSFRLGVGALRSPGPGFISFWTSICLAFFTGILLWGNLRQRIEVGHRMNMWKSHERRNSITAVVTLLVYCLALPKLGYLVATFGLMVVLFSLGKMRLWMTISGSLIAVLSSYWLFQYLSGSPLPKGILG
jgi:hypothetical protein